MRALARISQDLTCHRRSAIDGLIKTTERGDSVTGTPFFTYNGAKQRQFIGDQVEGDWSRPAHARKYGSGGRYKR
jgi:hypothetical protein